MSPRVGALGAQASPGRLLDAFGEAGFDAGLAAGTAYNLVIEARV